MKSGVFVLVAEWLVDYSSVTVNADDSDVIQTMCVANAQLSYRPSLGIQSSLKPTPP